MPNLPWRPRIDLITDGEQVSQSVTNRPIQQLAGQTLHLKQSLSGLETTSGRLIFTGANLTAEVDLGDVVYFDTFENAYAPAIAEAVTNTAAGEYVAGPRSYVVGVVIAKSGLVGDIIQLGRINLNEIDTSFVQDMVEDPINDPFVAGRYYLSAKIPGKITRHVVYPNVQVGYITKLECHIAPLQKDLFETHRHYTFPLLARPSASQNFGQSGWNHLGDITPTGRKWVDYFNNGVDTTVPPIMIAIRNNLSVQVDAGSAFRIELFRNGSDKLGVEIISGGLVDFDDPGSGTYPGTISQLDWPEYGEWISIPNTTLDVAFFRPLTLGTTLAADVAAGDLPVPVDEWNRFKIFVPHDIYGWTNINPGDDSVPYQSFYRYLHESDQPISNVFPPIPTGSAYIESNGTSLVPKQDFNVSITGIFWIPASFTVSYTYSPWPHDYNAQTTWVPIPDFSRNLNFHFSRVGLGNANSVVRTLKGTAPITVTECPTGIPADQGDLQVAIDLALLKGSADPVTYDTAFVDVSGTTFTLGDIVSELVAGPGIKIERLSTTRDKNVGKLALSRSDQKFEGEVSSIALRNAKQEMKPEYSYIDFLPPATVATGITAGFRIPSEGFIVNNLGFITNVAGVYLSLYGSFIGDTAMGVSQSTQTAVYQVIYRVLRRDAVGNLLAPIASHSWSVPYEAGYVPTKVLADVPSDDNAFKVPLSLFKPGDMVSVQIDRVVQDVNLVADTYAGRSGLVGLRWIIK